MLINSAPSPIGFSGGIEINKEAIVETSLLGTRWGNRKLNKVEKAVAENQDFIEKQTKKSVKMKYTTTKAGEEMIWYQFKIPAAENKAQFQEGSFKRDDFDSLASRSKFISAIAQSVKKMSDTNGLPDEEYGKPEPPSPQ